MHGELLTDTETAVNRVMGEYDPGKPYPFANILTPSKASRRLNYTAAVVLAGAVVYLVAKVLL